MIKWILKKLNCQRGEIGDDLDSTAIQDAIFTADVDDEGYTPPVDDDDDKKKKDKDDDPDEGDDKKKPGDDDDKKAADKKDDKKEDKPDKVSELEAKLIKAEKEISRLGYALRKDKKETKAEDKETPFTKAQLMQLYKENVENPEVVFQIMDEMTKLGKVDATVAAEKSVDIKTKRNELDQVLEKMYPDAKKEGTELYEGIQKAIEWAHLDGHPFANHLAFGLLAIKSLPETIKQIKEKVKAEVLETSEKDLAEKAEKARKKNIDATKPASKGKKSPDDTQAVSLTADQLDTLKRIVGPKPTKAQIARYSKMAGNKGGTIQAEE